MGNKLYQVCASFCFCVVGGKGKKVVLLSLSMIYHHAMMTPQQ